MPNAFSPAPLTARNCHRSTVSLLLALALTACSPGEYAASDDGSRGTQGIGSPELYGINVSAEGGPGAPAMADLGARWARVELMDYNRLSNTLTQGTRDRVNTVLSSYHAAGIKVLLIVDYTTYGDYPTYSPGGACGDMAAWKQGFLDRVEDAARSFGNRVDAWQVWNEPDQPLLGCGQWYNPGMPAQDFGDLLRQAAGRIRAGGSQTPIVTGGFNSGNVGYAQQALSAAQGAPLSGVAIHPYGQVPDASWCPAGGDGLNCSFAGLAAIVNAYHNGTGMPIWITELGVNSPNEDNQARYVTDAYKTLAKLGTGVVPHAFFFCATDAMVAPFGLMRADGSRKPAFAAYQQSASGSGTPIAPSDPPPSDPPGTPSDPHGTPGDPPPSDPGNGVCPCLTDKDNYCNYGAQYSACPMTQPGGYCDPNGDGNFDDADWVRGWNDYHDSCVAPPPTNPPTNPPPSNPPPSNPPPSGSCGCKAGVDNFCLYGVAVPNCAMTQPGGYCDPNGDGSFDDADWVRGWNEFKAQCG